MSELFDINILIELAGDDVESFLVIIDDFQENGAKLLGQMSIAIEGRDVTAIKALAHQLKGSSGMLGMKCLYGICIKVEAMDQVDEATLVEMKEIFQESVIAARQALRA